MCITGVLEERENEAEECLHSGQNLFKINGRHQTTGSWNSGNSKQKYKKLYTYTYHIEAVESQRQKILKESRERKYLTSREKEERKRELQ